jgi:thiamine biosynthesis lipoprotein
MTVTSSDRRLANATRRVWPRRAILSVLQPRPVTAGEAWIRLSRLAMACSFEVTLASEDACSVPAAQAALEEVERIEDHLTFFRDTSALSDINRRAGDGPVVVDRALFDLLRECVDIHRATSGAFDITSTPLSRCWGFLQRVARVPTAEAIAAARMNVGLDFVVLDAGLNTVRFSRQGIELNLGAIGKGYALDRVGADMRTAGVRHALLSAGRSSLLALGGRDGGWSIELTSPLANAVLARVWLHDAAMGTSGAGEQFIEVEGVRYGHVIDPRSGWPASGMLSTTVIADRAASADALSTAFFIGGPALARDYCANHPDTLALVTPQGDRAPIVIGGHPGARVEVV